MIVDAAKGAIGQSGSLALVGTGEALATLDIKDLIRGGKSVRGVMEGDADPIRFVPQLIELVQQGRLPIDRMMTPLPVRRHQPRRRGRQVPARRSSRS